MLLNTVQDHLKRLTNLSLVFFILVALLFYKNVPIVWRKKRLVWNLYLLKASYLPIWYYFMPENRAMIELTWGLAFDPRTAPCPRVQLTWSIIIAFYLKGRWKNECSIKNNMRLIIILLPFGFYFGHPVPTYSKREHPVHFAPWVTKYVTRGFVRPICLFSSTKSPRLQSHVTLWAVSTYLILYIIFI